MKICISVIYMFLEIMKQKLARFSDHWMFNTKNLLYGGVVYVSSKSWRFYCAYFKKAYISILLKAPQRVSNGKRNLKFCALYYSKNLYYNRQLESRYTSNLSYIASCFFIPSQYDVYWPLSNAALSGAISECVFHNRNIFIYWELANCLHQYCNFKTWKLVITF